MIHLNIKEYCKNCTNFEPEASTFEAGQQVPWKYIRWCIVQKEIFVWEYMST